MTEKFAINSTRIAIADPNGLPTAEMYRWMVKVQGVTGDGVVGDLLVAPIITFDDSDVLTGSLKLIDGTGIDLTQGAGTITVSISASVVTESGTQTLTNKTLTAPAISGGSINNTVIGGLVPREAAFTGLQAVEMLTLPDYTIGTLPDPTTYPWGFVAVSDEVGGPVPAFSDGTDWRRVTDRAVVS